MRLSLTYVFIIAFIQTLIAQSNIEFKSISFKDALILAETDNKPIFIDIYTTWCGPCKKMEKEIFAIPDVAQKYNESFINLKIDAEKGEGLAIAKTYQVMAYPTYLFIDAKGELVYKVIGFKNKFEFIREASFALNEFAESKRIAQWDTEFKDNNQNKPFLYGYIKKRNTLMIDSRELIDKYYSLLSENETTIDSNLYLIERTLKIIPNGVVYKALCRNFSKLSADLNPTRLKSLHDKLHQSIIDAQMYASLNKNDSLFRNVVLPAYAILPEINSKPWLADRREEDHKMFHYIGTGQYNQFVSEISSYLNMISTITLNKIRKKDAELYEQVSNQLKDEPNRILIEMTLMQMKDYYSNLYYNFLFSGSKFVLQNSNSKNELICAENWIEKAVEIKPTEEAGTMLKEVRKKIPYK